MGESQKQEQPKPRLCEFSDGSVINLDLVTMVHVQPDGSSIVYLAGNAPPFSLDASYYEYFQREVGQKVMNVDSPVHIHATPATPEVREPRAARPPKPGSRRP